tara:strand:+ start:1727 stop:1930 length:204 start_codon:yes stop_codon:yes gene_type:complete
MKNIVEEQIKKDYKNNPHFIRYLKDNETKKLYVVFYNYDNENNEVIYETRGLVEMFRLKDFFDNILI